jgi:hypothetical protein
MLLVNWLRGDSAVRLTAGTRQVYLYSQCLSIIDASSFCFAGPLRLQMVSANLRTDAFMKNEPHLDCPSLF